MTKIKKGIVFSLLFVVFSLNAQLTKGFQHINELKWKSAQTAFASATEEEALFFNGLSLIKIDQEDKAKALFESAADKPFGMIGLGMLALNAKNDAKAEEYFQNASKITKNKDPKVFIAIGQAYANSQATNKEKGMEWSKKAVDMSPRNFDFRILYGDACVMAQDGGQAITQYEYAADFDKNNALPDAKIARVYLNSKNYTLAKEYFDKALAKDPNNLFALNYFGYMQYLYKNYSEAKTTYQTILEKGDRLPEDLAMMANIHFYLKEYSSLIPIVEEATKKSDKNNYLNRLIGYSYYETGKYTEALNYLNNFMATQPKDKIIGDDYEYLSKATLASGGDTSKAISFLEQAVEAKPDDADLIRKVADILRSMKQFDKAISYYKARVEMPNPSLDDYFQLAGAYYAKKDYANAEIWYGKVIELSPNSPGTYYQRANVKLYADPEQKTASARDDFKKFVELTINAKDKFKTPIVKSNIYLAKDALKNLNDNALAKQYIDSVLELDPTNAEAIDLQKFLK